MVSEEHRKEYDALPDRSPARTEIIIKVVEEFKQNDRRFMKESTPGLYVKADDAHAQQVTRSESNKTVSPPESLASIILTSHAFACSRFCVCSRF
jgi:hypothetical protein